MSLRKDSVPILYRYVIHQILRYAAVILVIVVGIYLVVDFFERIDNFIEAGLPVSRTLVYLAYKIPTIIAQILPVALLLAVMVTLGLMGKHNEVVALKSGGISYHRLVRPLVGVGVLFSLLLFITAEVFVPVTAAKSNAIWWEEVKQRSAVLSREKNIWLKDDQRIAHIKFYDRDAGTAHGITVYVFDEAFRMVRRIDAATAVYEPSYARGIGHWQLFELMEQVLDPASGQYRVSSEDGPLGFSLGITPENLETVVKKSEEMSLPELRAYIRRIESEGYDATRYRVDLYAKTAFPFVCVILSLVSAGIAGRRNVRDGLPVGITYGIGIAFLYWIFYSFCISIGYGGMIPPAVAAWTANFLFLCLAVFVLMSVA